MAKNTLVRDIKNLMSEIKDNNVDMDDVYQSLGWMLDALKAKNTPLFEHKVVIDVSFSDVAQNESDMEISYTLHVESGSVLQHELTTEADYTTWEADDDDRITWQLVVFSCNPKKFYRIIEQQYNPHSYYYKWAMEMRRKFFAHEVTDVQFAEMVVAEINCSRWDVQDKYRICFITQQALQVTRGEEHVIALVNELFNWCYSL